MLWIFLTGPSRRVDTQARERSSGHLSASDIMDKAVCWRAGTEWKLAGLHQRLLNPATAVCVGERERQREREVGVGRPRQSLIQAHRDGTHGVRAHTQRPLTFEALAKPQLLTVRCWETNRKLPRRADVLTLDVGQKWSKINGGLDQKVGPLYIKIKYSFSTGNTQ